MEAEQALNTVVLSRLRFLPMVDKLGSGPSLPAQRQRRGGGSGGSGSQQPLAALHAL